jgi:tRNA-Thr(GGU) m(6)t(6)A37 methyltransferase TsaA
MARLKPFYLNLNKRSPMNAMTERGEIRFIGEVKTEGVDSKIEIAPEHCPGLLGIEKYSHLIVLYWFHQRDNDKHRKVLQVTPPRHPGAPLTGVFACRSPSRPNPVGLSIVRLIEVNNCHLTVKGLDAFQGSPIIDIKPYLPRSDSVPGAVTPKYINPTD